MILFCVFYSSKNYKLIYEIREIEVINCLRHSLLQIGEFG